MAEKNNGTKRNKPKFLRNDWHKKIKLGSTVKKKRKWKGAKGRHNKLRLNKKGHSQRPKVGWGADTSAKNFIRGIRAVRIENIKELKTLKKDAGIIIGAVGKRKREAIITKAKEMKIKILNRYKKIASENKLPAEEKK